MAEPERILVVEDAPEVAQLLEIELGQAGYETSVVGDGDEVLQQTLYLRPDLVLLDGMLPGVDGVELCRRLRQDPRTASVGIIMLTARGTVAERLAGLDAGADDYLVKPFDHEELLARVATNLRRNHQLRGVSPLTGLPGNFEIRQRLDGLVERAEPFALLHADLDNFKSFNDRYGFVRGDDAIALTGRVVFQAVGEAGGTDAFVGHVGGDDFIVVCEPNRAVSIAEAIVAAFDGQVALLYDPADQEQGYIEITDRKGEVHRRPFLAVSIGIATTEQRPLGSAVAAAAVAAEMKQVAKQQAGSAWRLDRRRA